MVTFSTFETSKIRSTVNTSSEEMNAKIFQGLRSGSNLVKTEGQLPKGGLKLKVFSEVNIEPD